MPGEREQEHDAQRSGGDGGPRQCLEERLPPAHYRAPVGVGFKY